MRASGGSVKTESNASLNSSVSDLPVQRPPNPCRWNHEYPLVSMTHNPWRGRRQCVRIHWRGRSRLGSGEQLASARSWSSPAPIPHGLNTALIYSCGSRQSSWRIQPKNGSHERRPRITISQGNIRSRYSLLFGMLGYCFSMKAGGSRDGQAKILPLQHIDFSISALVVHRAEV